MPRVWVVVFLCLAVALAAAEPAASSNRSSGTWATLCETLPTGTTLTLPVPQRLAWPLVRAGAWEGRCGLRRAASIQGRITDVSGKPVAGICVEATVLDPSNDISGSVLLTTDRTGRYRTWVPFAGNLHLLFGRTDSISQYDPDPEATLGGCNGPFVSEWYDNIPTSGHALLSSTAIPVGASSRVSGLDAVLARWGAIRGTLTDSENGTPIAGALVTVAENPDYCTTTGADGTYDDLVAPGTYHVHFNPTFSEGCPGPPPPSFFDEWYRDEPDQGSADAVVVGDGKTVSGVDGALTPGGRVSGTVTDAASGLPLEFDSQVCITERSSLITSCALSGNGGGYSFAPLLPGSYVVQFTADQHVTQWFDDVTTEAAAAVIAVGSHTDRTGVDAALAPAS